MIVSFVKNRKFIVNIRGEESTPNLQDWHNVQFYLLYSTQYIHPTSRTLKTVKWGCFTEATKQIISKRVNSEEKKEVKKHQVYKINFSSFNCHRFEITKSFSNSEHLLTTFFYVDASQIAKLSGFNKFTKSSKLAALKT